MNLDKLIEAFLIEAAALTKGSQRVMADKKLVPALAATVRDDAAINPASFPPGSKRNFQKASDEEVAQWFLENIDAIEKKGYENVVYSRDGVNSDWITRRYIAGSHNWEDLTGVMNMNLFDWYALKNRNALDPAHKELSKFNSVRQLGSYMVTHYADALEEIRDAAKNAAKDKMAKAIKLVDNEQYKIFSTLNWSAAVKLGRGTQWCTANSTNDGNYRRYSSEGMLFQMYPAEPDHVDKVGQFSGRKTTGAEKYQFGPDDAYSFKDIADDQVSKQEIRTKYPYLYTDLVAGLRKNKVTLDKVTDELLADQSFQTLETKVAKYDIDKEIKKLHRFVDLGYMTEEKRPSKAETSAEEPAGEQPQLGAASAQEQPPQEPQMETLKDLAKAMLEDKTLGHFVQQYKPLNKAGQESPMTHGGDNLDETNVDECGLGQAKQGLIAALAARSGKSQQAVGEDDAMMQDPAAGGDMGAQAATGGTLGGGGGGAGGGQYPPGTAPTMPESIQQKGIAMENVDKDVAAMMASLKKYDKLNESVLGMVTLSMAKPKVVEAGKPWEDAEEEEKDSKEEVEEDVEVQKIPYKEPRKGEKTNYGSKHIGSATGQGSRGQQRGSNANVSTGKKTGDKTALPVVKEAGPDKSSVPAAFRKEKGGDWKTSKADLDKEAGKSPTTKKGLEDLKAKKDIKESNQVDPEILDWMNRFSKLGNMKGYGR